MRKERTKGDQRTHKPTMDQREVSDDALDKVTGGFGGTLTQPLSVNRDNAGATTASNTGKTPS